MKLSEMLDFKANYAFIFKGEKKHGGKPLVIAMFEMKFNAEEFMRNYSVSEYDKENLYAIVAIEND